MNFQLHDHNEVDFYSTCQGSTKLQQNIKQQFHESKNWKLTEDILRITTPKVIIKFKKDHIYLTSQNSICKGYPLIQLQLTSSQFETINDCCKNLLEKLFNTKFFLDALSKYVVPEIADVIVDYNKMITTENHATLFSVFVQMLCVGSNCFSIQKRINAIQAPSRANVRKFHTQQMCF